MSPLAALIIDWVITALWPIIGKSGMDFFSGTLFVPAGFLIGFLALSPWLVARGHWRKLFDPDIAPMLVLMGLFSTIATIIFIGALAYTTSANAAIMAQIEVLYSALLCFYLLKEPLTLRQSAASLLVVAGTGLIMAHDVSSARWKGDLMILVTPWMYQISHICSKRLPKGLDTVTIACGRILYGLLAAVPFVLWTLCHGPRWTWSLPAAGVLLAQGLGMSSVNFVLWYRAILNMDLAKATTIMLSYPALTVIFAWALGREQIHPIQIAGLFVTLSGAYWVSRLVLDSQKELPKRLRVPPETAAQI